MLTGFWLKEFGQVKVSEPDIHYEQVTRRIR